MAGFNVPGIGGMAGASRLLDMAMSQSQKSLEKLSSGLRINRSADDPAGLSVSESLRSQVRELNRASMNALDAVSMTQVADAGMGEVSAAVQNIRELSVYAGNPALSGDDLGAIQAEIDANLAHVDTVVQTTEFNGNQLLSGSMGFDAGTGSLGISGLDVTNPANAPAAISAADNAIGKLGSMRAGLGASQNRLESNIRSLDIAAENTLAAESRIRDLDIAEETVKLTQSQVLGQLAISAMSHAKLNAEAVLKLL